MNTLTNPANKNIAKMSIAENAVMQGIATNYWLELIPYPVSSERCLWLYVNNAWYRKFNSPSSMEERVQNAFINSDKFEVAVWYEEGQIEIQGLVVRIKE